MTAPNAAGVVDRVDAFTVDGERRPYRGFAWRNWPVVLVSCIIAGALLAPSVAPYDPLQVAVGAPLQSPSALHPFGTDQAGRDLLSRVLAGGRVSIVVGVLSVVVAGVLGGLLGTVAAAVRRGPRELIMRILDVFLSFPGILLAIILAAALGRGIVTVVIVIAVVFTAPVARLVRAVVAAELEEDYVAAARLIGTGRARLLGRHVAINALPSVLVYATTLLAEAIIIEAGLSFIGVGISPPAPSWGNIMFEGQAFLYTGQWWIGLFPGAGIFLTVLLLNTAADALSDRFDTGVERP
jgi:peptide/nickel transport system permease protein